MTFIYGLDPYCLKLYRMCKYELPMSRLLEVIVRQTVLTEIIKQAALHVFKKCEREKLNYIFNQHICLCGFVF